MKQIILLSMFSLVSCSYVHAQIKSEKYYNHQTEQALKAQAQPKRKMGVVTKVGIACMGAGIITAIVGEQQIERDERKKDASGIGEGATPFLIGAISFFVGTGMTIGGVISDGRRVRHERLSLIAPKWNEVGLAYNF